jgi:hypothetical protein
LRVSEEEKEQARCDSVERPGRNHAAVDMGSMSASLRRLVSRGKLCGENVGTNPGAVDSLCSLIHVVCCSAGALLGTHELGCTMCHPWDGGMLAPEIKPGKQCCAHIVGRGKHSMQRIKFRYLF